jgi:hypothetical protein
MGKQSWHINRSRTLSGIPSHILVYAQIISTAIDDYPLLFAGYQHLETENDGQDFNLPSTSIHRIETSAFL